MRAERARILVVDDHLEMAQLLAEQLSEEGHVVDVAGGANQALELARTRLPELVITDLRMEGVDGFDLLASLHQLDPELPVLLMTAFGAIETAVEAIKRGAYHYLTKPFQLDELRVYVERALADRRLREENRNLRRLAQDRSRLEAIVGKSSPMQALYELVERVAGAGEHVIIRGESGTGKELVARAVHFLGPRKDRAFVAVNCTSLPAALLESELFGHVKGAFTGASDARRGLFLEADGGTLFLDEIGDMPIELQAKMLRVLEDGVIRAVGADTPKQVDLRIVAATHQPLEDLVSQGRFRADLFYRLNVLPIAVPSLRDRLDDLPLLVEHFLARSRESNPRLRVRSFSSGALAALSSYGWPGNVRELENVVKRLAVVAAGEEVSDTELLRHAPMLELASPIARAKSELYTLRQLEDEYIAYVVQRSGGNKTKAAELLGIDVSTIHRREKGPR
ncbi:MAG: sigma-54-dependent Fis family transcriptional regulator [Deltaproteobacteria bacterium]|jgi:two-component system response regulator HydG|nr:sigma-54-dependent Fis family transcriptional regulator [Deltaproteobacteria bacterium]